MNYRSSQFAGFAALTLAATFAANMPAIAQESSNGNAPGAPPGQNSDVFGTDRETRFRDEGDLEMRGPDAQFVPSRDTVSSMKAYNMVLKVADCLVNAGQTRVIATLATQPGSGSESRSFAQGHRLHKECGKQYTTILSLQRGSQSEKLYLKQHPTPMAAQGAAANAMTFMQGEKDWNAKREQGDQVMIGATNCLVASNPALVDALLRTTHGTDAEASVVGSIFASSPHCAGAIMPPGLSRTFLRAFLADSLYRASAGPNKFPLFAD